MPCFLGDGDHQRCLQCLRQALLGYGVQLHADVLMSNHLHLLLTPGELGALARMMHTFGRTAWVFCNDRHRSTETVWEGRYKACLADSQN